MIKIIPEKLKNMWKVLNNYPHITKIFSLVILTVLMSLPFGMDKMDLFNTDYTPPLLYPFTVLSSKALRNEFHFFYISCFSFFLLPLTFAITIASIFQKKLTDRIVFISTLLTVTLRFGSGSTCKYGALVPRSKFFGICGILYCARLSYHINCAGDSVYKSTK